MGQNAGDSQWLDVHVTLNGATKTDRVMLVLHPGATYVTMNTGYAQTIVSVNVTRTPMDKGTHLKEYAEHGLGMYRYRKCRCDICKAAAAADRLKYRKHIRRQRLYLPAAPLIERLQWANKLDEVPGDTMKSWRMKGINVYSADYWCLKFGYHPAEIYGHLFYQGCFDEEMAS